MDIFCYVVCLALIVVSSYGGELTFELPDNEKQCFYENIDELDLECTIEFQVVT